jgi:head-tail adaptor
MRAGALDRRITLRRLVEGRSGSGAVVYTPQNVATVWAQKMPDRGTEGFREAQVQGWSVVIWRIRYFRDGLEEPTVKWEILEGSRVHEILEVRELGRRDGWELVTRARAEDQVA